MCTSTHFDRGLRLIFETILEHKRFPIEPSYLQQYVQCIGIGEKVSTSTMSDMPILVYIAPYNTTIMSCIIGPIENRVAKIVKCFI